MIRKLLLILPLILLFFAPLLQAQQKISGNPTSFVSELGAMIEDIPQKEKQKEAEAFLEDFAAWWQSAPIDDSLSGQACLLVQKMIDRKLRLQPNILNYLETLKQFPFDKFTDQDLKVWLRFSNDLLKSKDARKFTELVETSGILFSELYIYFSRSISWQLINPSTIAFKYDSTLSLHCTGTELKGMVSGDTTLIRETSGVFYFLDQQWLGRGGKIGWERVGFDPGSVFVEIPDYALKLQSSSFEIDSAVFTHKEYLEKPLLGRFEEKLMMQLNVERASYPRFISYYSDLFLKEIFPDIDYHGGFTLQGNKILGSGSSDSKAVLDLKRKGKLFIRLRSPAFAISPDRISATRASVSIYYESDSIFHPGLKMRYLNENRELSLIRTDEGIGDSPFMDTWHNLDLYSEAVYWKMDASNVDFQDIKGLNSEGRAFFESLDYYSQERYDLLQGIDDQNPLDMIFRFASRLSQPHFYLDDYVAFLRKPPEQVKAVLLNLASRGFLNYDLDLDRIFVKERLFKYIRARSGNADYDVMQLRSTITALPNASLSLLNFDLTLRGVPAVFLSDSQQVIIYPADQELVMKQNRSFTFSGKIQAGYFIFHSRESNFSYEDFKINMPVIDEMKFRVKSFQPDGNGFYSLVPVETVLRDLSGEILIDKPFNKSGKDPNPEYPIFTASSEAFVYYDDRAIEGGVYTRDRFNYRILPFTIDSLDNFNTTALNFKGYLNSGGIFPDISESLKVQADYSLGFITTAPVNGYPLYGGKGTYYSTIDLSNRGLRGRGSIDYLASSLESEDIIFYLDSCRALVDNFTLKEQSSGPEFPMSSGQKLDMLWLPYEDELHLENTADPILMYAGDATLDGSLQISPQGLSGGGDLEFENAKMYAKEYTFLHHEFNADTADFSLKAYDLSELAFAIKDYRAHVDLQKRRGEFLSNGGVARVEFLLNDYITFMDECIWLMDEDRISLRNTTAIKKDYSGLTYRDLVEEDLIGSEFISVHPAQDSLRFLAERGIFDLKDNVIRAEGVQLIRVADAAIFPDKQKVSVYPKAEMGTLEKAVVLTDLDKKYHLMNQGVINIFSANSYSGQAVYPYVDETGTTIDILMHKLGVDEGVSYALASISDSAGIYLSPAFAYKGDVRMDAPEQLLEFDGAFRIAHDCDTMQRSWIRFASRINPDTLIIPLTSPLKDLATKDIEAAILYSARLEGMYPAFLQRKATYSDEVVVSSGQAITYDKVSQEYRIASRERLLGLLDYGNYLSLSKKDCSVLGVGDVSLGLDFGKVQARGYGAVHHLMVPDSTWLQISLSLDFFFSKDALKLMADDIEMSSLAAMDISSGYYTSSIYSVLGKEEADDVIAEINMYGSLEKIPEALQQTLIISNVVLGWNEISRTWISEGPIGLASLGGKQLNREVPGKLVVERKRSGDVFTLYLEAGDGNWYMLSYSRGLMQTIAASNEFNTIIREEKPDDRTLDVKKGEFSYRYIISTDRKRKDFVRRYMQSELEEE